MTISHFFQIAILVLAALCFYWAWRVETPYGGDAGLGDAIAKLIGYGASVILVFIVMVWFVVQHVVFR